MDHYRERGKTSCSVVLRLCILSMMDWQGSDYSLEVELLTTHILSGKYHAVTITFPQTFVWSSRAVALIFGLCPLIRVIILIINSYKSVELITDN